MAPTAPSMLKLTTKDTTLTTTMILLTTTMLMRIMVAMMMVMVMEIASASYKILVP